MDSNVTEEYNEELGGTFLFSLCKSKSRLDARSGIPVEEVNYVGSTEISQWTKKYLHTIY